MSTRDTATPEETTDLVINETQKWHGPVAVIALLLVVLLGLGLWWSHSSISDNLSAAKTSLGERIDGVKRVTDAAAPYVLPALDARGNIVAKPVVATMKENLDHLEKTSATKDELKALGEKHDALRKEFDTLNKAAAPVVLPSMNDEGEEVKPLIETMTVSMTELEQSAYRHKVQLRVAQWTGDVYAFADAERIRKAVVALHKDATNTDALAVMGEYRLEANEVLEAAYPTPPAPPVAAAPH